MLTAELVHARRHKGELRLTVLNAERRARALELAEQLAAIAESHVGLTREELYEAWSVVPVAARDRKLADGLRKLIEDRIAFEVAVEADPSALRRAVFEAAAHARRQLADDAAFDRDHVLREVASAHAIDADVLERGLYADLRGAHVLKELDAVVPRALVDGYDLEQARAVLLRAVHVTARISKPGPAELRLLFRRLKFLRLLYRIEREPDGSFRVEIDGPFSLFESVTKYGLSLAMALPAIAACGEWSIEAEVRWGKARVPMTFRLTGDARANTDVPDRLPDEVQALLERFEDRAGAWRARVADEVLNLPGVGLCVPDLAFTHRDTGEVVLLEVMGFWSRNAVWKRVELVEAGLPHKILFAVSQRLRVSEAVLDESAPSALYVYKGSISPKAIEGKLDALLARRRR